MRKVFLMALLLIFCAMTQAQALVRNIQDNYKFTYSIIDTAGDHVTGQSPTVQIQRASDGFWFDFNDSTFKNSAWTNKTTTLTEDSTNGFYYYTYNPPAGETGAEQYVFVVDNGDSTYGDRQTLAVDYQNIGTGTSTLTASDNIGVNWADVSNPTTTLALTGTTISGSGASAADIADAVWDEAIAGHLTAGTTGFKLNAAGNAGDPWSTDVSTGYTGQAGEYIRNIKDSTDGDQESGAYTGIEKTIRNQR